MKHDKCQKKGHKSKLLAQAKLNFVAGGARSQAIWDRPLRKRESPGTGAREKL